MDSDKLMRYHLVMHLRNSTNQSGLKTVEHNLVLVHYGAFVKILFTYDYFSSLIPREQNRPVKLGSRSVKVQVLLRRVSAGSDSPHK